VQTEQAVIKLPYDVFRTQKVVEEPLLPESSDVCTKNGGGIRPKIAWLIHGHKDVLELQRIYLKVALATNMTECSRVKWIFWVPENRATVCL
jgi:hypothetical protein